MKSELSRNFWIGRLRRSLWTLILTLVIFSLGTWQMTRSLRKVHAQAQPARLDLASPRQFETSYRGPAHARLVMGGHPTALSMAAGDLDGDAITDLAIGFTAPGGGLIAIHHGNLDAFAPQSEKTFWAISRGDFPSPYLSQADLVEIPTQPDFLAEGDLIGRHGSALAAASRGGNTISVLSRDDTGAMQVQQTITVPGSITSMDVHDLAHAKFAHLVVGVHTDSGPQLLIYTGAHLGLTQTGNFPLPADAASFVSGDLDGDGIPDLLVVAGGGVSILHSTSKTLEKVPTPFTVARAALGRFLHDRSSLLQMALLATDGSLHIMGREGLDPAHYTVQEFQAHRRAQLARRPKVKQHGLAPAPQAAPAPLRAVAWKEVESTSGVGAPDGGGKAPLLFRTRVSNHGADDVMLMSSAKLTVLAHPTSQPSQTEVHDRTDLGADVVAAVPVRVNVDGRPGLVYIARGQTTPSVIVNNTGVTYNVTSTADALNSGACAANSPTLCTLREAIVEANAQGNVVTIMIPNNTYTLSIARAGSPVYDAKTGTLDVTQSVNLVGSGQNTTIIQGGTKGANDAGGPNGVDKVFSFNQDIISTTDATVTISALTIQNGFNRGNTSIGDGWGGAFDCDTGTDGNASVTLTNVTLTNNTLTEGEGGGFATFRDNTGGSGMVTLTASTVSNNVTQVSTNHSWGNGGGIAVEDAAKLLMTGGSVTGNQAKNRGSDFASSGGIEDVGSGFDINGQNFVTNLVTLHNVTISNNASGSTGGGFGVNGTVCCALVIDQESVISGNSANGDGAGIDTGVYSNPNFPSFSTTFSNITVTGNNTNGTDSEGRGAGIFVSGGYTNTTGLTMNYSRISGNSGVSGEGSGLAWEENPSTPNTGQTINIADNWWGTNADPTSTANPPIAVDPNGASNGTITYLPYIVFTYTPSATTLKINTSTSLTADVAHDSTGSTAGLSGHLAVFSGLPVIFSSGSGGSITTAQPVTFNSSGSTTSTFQAGGSGATVSTSATFDGVTVNATIVVLQPPSMTMGFNPTTVTPNTASTLTFTITNGNTVAIDSNFTDTLPTNMKVAPTPSVVNNCGSSVTASAGASSISWSNSALPVSTCTIKVNVVATVDNTYTDSVTIDSTAAGNAASASSATLTVINPPTLTKSFSPASIPLNGTTTMTITVSSTNTNLGLTGVGFTDTLPSGMSVASPSNLNSTCDGSAAAATNVTLSGASLAAGASCAVTVTMKGTSLASITNTVTPTSTNGGNGTAGSATLTVVAPPTISKSFGASSIALNANTSLSFTVSNPNSGTNTSLHGIGFTDNLPAGLTVATPNGLSGSCGGGTITATAGSGSINLSGATLTGTGGSSTCTFSVNVTGIAGGTQNNVTSAVTSTESGSGLTASASINVEAPPSITKSFGAGTIAFNATTPLTFTITNPAGNPASLTGVAFTDIIPTGLTVSSATTSQCGGTLTVTSPVTISLAGATVAVGTPCQFSVTVTGASAGGYTNTTGNVTSANGGTGNTATANLTVGALTTVTNVTSTTANGSYGTATVIPIQVTFSKTVTVTGTPHLALNSGGTALYTSGSGASTLTFTYTVGAGENSAHLDAASTSALTLNGGTILDSNSAAPSLTLPVGNTAGSLSSNKNIVIDTVAPTVVSYSVLFGNQSYNVIGSARTRLPWQITGIQVVFSKTIGSADLASISGVSATGFSGLGTNTLTWTISPVVDANLATALAGSGANAIKDVAGNGLSGGSGFSQNLKVLWGDFNDDGVVSATDLAGVNNARNQTYNIFADLNGDGVVDINDVQIARTRVGTSLP